MSIANALKRALGFHTVIDDEDEMYDSTLPTYAPVKDSVPAHKSEEPAAAAQGDETAVLAGDLFDALIEMFNASMPDFVAKCLSTDAQRQYLLDSLDGSLRRRIAQAAPMCPAPAPAAPAHDDDSARLRDEMERLRLSAERQKRALTDRVLDLQSKIEDLQAEKEQLEGKMKMVQEERESMRRTIEQNLYNQAHAESKLRKEIKQLEKKLAAASGAQPDEQPKSKRRRKISAIDESIDSTDWFDSTPPPGEGKPEQPDNPDFGYQAPQRKKHTDNDAQMLLW